MRRSRRSHADCAMCAVFREAINRAISPAERIAAQSAYDAYLNCFAGY